MVTTDTPAPSTPEIETWERLQARLFHLGWLGEELPAFVTTTVTATTGTATRAGAGGSWLYREIAREAATVARIATAYLAECARIATGTTHTRTTGTGTGQAGAGSGGAGRGGAGRDRRSWRDGGGAA